VQEGAYALAEYSLAKDERTNMNVAILSLCAYFSTVLREFLTEEERRTILGSKSLQNCVQNRDKK
jgi:hypothetical protein